MKPFSKINIGDVYPSRFTWTGSDVTWEVLNKDKDSKLVEVRSSYQHPALAKTLWLKTSNPIFRADPIIKGKEPSEVKVINFN